MKIVKKVIPMILILLFTLTPLVTPTVNATYKAPFEINSQAAYLVNTDTDTVIFEQNATEKLHPASLTKIMTTILALEMIPDLDNTMVYGEPYIFDELYLSGASHADIRHHEEVRAIDLLYAVMLPSGCEAASMIADHISGNITEFTELMNKKAKEIGAMDTNFTNAHGLHNPEQVTTAKDMYLITNYAMNMDDGLFAKISNTPTYMMPATNKHAEPYLIEHTNNLIRKGKELYTPSVKGVKTGYIPESGSNLATTASLDGYNYTLVTLGAPKHDAEGTLLPNGAMLDAQELYNWAFSFFKQQTIMNEGDVISETDVSLSTEQDHLILVAKDDVYALLPRGADRSTIQEIVSVEENLIAPIKKGTVYGKVDLKLNDEIITTVDLVALEDINRSGLLYGMDLIKRFFDQSIVVVLIIILILLILILFVLKARYRRYKRRRNNRMRAMNR